MVTAGLKTDISSAVKIDQTLTRGGIAIADNAAQLHQLKQQGCGGVLWRRSVSLDVLAWLRALDPSDFPQIRAVFQPAATCDQIDRAFTIAGTPQGVERDALLHDLSHCIEGFCALMRPPFLQLRLEVVDDDACRIFHMDNVTARMITTFRGPGTEFGYARDGAQPDETVFAPTGSPLILRGKQWSADLAEPIVHRSPAIEGTGQVRFLMVIDPLQTPDGI